MPKAVGEKYPKDFVESTTKYRESLINWMSYLGIFQSSGNNLLVSPFNERRFVVLWKHFNNRDSMADTILVYFIPLVRSWFGIFYAQSIHARGVKAISVLSNNPKGRVPRALPVGEWELAQRTSSVACVLKRVPRALKDLGRDRDRQGSGQGGKYDYWEVKKTLETICGRWLPWPFWVFQLSSYRVQPVRCPTGYDSAKKEDQYPIVKEQSTVSITPAFQSSKFLLFRSRSFWKSQSWKAFSQKRTIPASSHKPKPTAFRSVVV